MKNGRIVGLSDRSATSRYIPNINFMKNIALLSSICVDSVEVSLRGTSRFFAFQLAFVGGPLAFAGVSLPGIILFH